MIFVEAGAAVDTESPPGVVYGGLPGGENGHAAMGMLRDLPTVFGDMVTGGLAIGWKGNPR
jgi:hypothetical protein